ncbi:hypothetical protein V7127_00600 [Bacillus sp. JJ1773]|uniref:hypothetical protein n=1 Tax=Bacillus sp. JJ1773 TaxID=3122965 RepID=UPI002FFD69E9
MLEGHFKGRSRSKSPSSGAGRTYQGKKSFKKSKQWCWTDISREVVVQKVQADQGYSALYEEFSVLS